MNGLAFSEDSHVIPGAKASSTHLALAMLHCNPQDVLAEPNHCGTQIATGSRHQTTALYSVGEEAG